MTFSWPLAPGPVGSVRERLKFGGTGGSWEKSKRSPWPFLVGDELRQGLPAATVRGGAPRSSRQNPMPQSKESAASRPLPSSEAVGRGGSTLKALSETHRGSAATPKSAPLTSGSPGGALGRRGGAGTRKGLGGGEMPLEKPPASLRAPEPASPSCATAIRQELSGISTS